MMYLLFYYTEFLHISIEVAATCYFLASIWDGVASLLVGVIFDRFAGEAQFQQSLVFGAVPLGLAFIMAYSPPSFGVGVVAWVLSGQILFRSAYALVNVPYLAMSARISAGTNDRALVAGMRMLAGTAASLLVAIGSAPIGLWLSGGDGAKVYAQSARIFAVAATAILVGVGLTYRDGAIPLPRNRGSVGGSLLGAWRNRAFVTLAVSMATMIIAVTVLNKSILYYFKYRLHDQTAGALTLGWMTAVSGCALPIWMLISRAIGVRALWFLAIGLGVIWLGLFIFCELQTTLLTQIFLILMQVTIVGLNFAVWAMLPDTVEFGQRATGMRVEAVLYGYVALIQRVAIGLGTVLLGLSLKQSGFSAVGRQTLATLAMFRVNLALVPLGFLLVSAVIMAFNPLRRGLHDAIIREIKA